MIEYFTSLRVDGDAVEITMPRRKKVGFLSSRDRWLSNTLNNIKFRCTNPKDKKFDAYGGRGIQCLLSLDDLQKLYERDRPDLMLKPSIDRENNDGNYDFGNCRFIELRENIHLASAPIHRCRVCNEIGSKGRKRLCPKCTRLEKLRKTSYPSYVWHVIDRAVENGLEVDRVLGRNYGKKKNLRISGYLVKLHYAAVMSSTGGAVRYWRFNVNDPLADFHILVARWHKTFQIFIFEGLPNSPCLYVPVLARDREAQRSFYDWERLKDAWHLLSPTKTESVVSISHAQQSTFPEAP